MIFGLTFFLINFNFFTTPKSQKSNVWCLKVLSSSQNHQQPIPIIICQMSHFYTPNSWRVEILSKLPLFELDSKVALTWVYWANWNCCASYPSWGFPPPQKKIISFTFWKYNQRLYQQSPFLFEFICFIQCFSNIRILTSDIYFHWIWMSEK